MNKAEEHPDDVANSKARTLVEFARWFTTVDDIRQEKDGEIEAANKKRDIFYWIDYSCMDQDNPVAGIRSLPLYTAACENFLCFETPDYLNRAWCRVECLMAHNFMRRSMRYIIDVNFRFENNKPRLDNRTLHNPAEGDLAYESDRDVIKQLQSEAERSVTLGFERDVDEEGKSTKKAGVRKTEYGGTKVPVIVF